MADFYQIYKKEKFIQKNMHNYNVFLAYTCLNRLPLIEQRIFAGIRNLQKSIEVERFGIKFDRRIPLNKRVHLSIPHTVKTVDIPQGEIKTESCICQDYVGVLNNLILNKGYTNLKITGQTDVHNVCVVQATIGQFR